MKKNQEPVRPLILGPGGDISMYQKIAYYSHVGVAVSHVTHPRSGPESSVQVSSNSPTVFSTAWGHFT